MRTQKYGIKIPKTVANARRIDTANGNTLWQVAIDLEMKNVRVAFKLYNGDPTLLTRYKPLTTHFVIYIKLGEKFRCESLTARGQSQD